MTEQAQIDLYNNTVIPQIRESGTVITLHSANSGTFDPETGFTGGSADTDYTGYGLETESTLDSIPATVAEKVEKTIMAIEIPEPKQLQDTLLLRGIVYKILFVEPVQPGNVLFYYLLYLGK